MPNGYYLGKIVNVSQRVASFRTTDGSVVSLCTDELIRKLGGRLKAADLIKFSMLELGLSAGTRGTFSVNYAKIR